MNYRDGQALVALRFAGLGQDRLELLGDDGRDQLAALCDGMSINGDKREAINTILAATQVVSEPIAEVEIQSESSQTPIVSDED